MLHHEDPTLHREAGERVAEDAAVVLPEDDPLVRRGAPVAAVLPSKGDHQLSIESWQSWINDPFYHLYFNFSSKAINTNTAFYSNPELDKILAENMRAPQSDQRLAAAKQAQKLLIDDAVWGLLWYDNWTRVMRSDLVGVEKRWDTFERYYDMKLA